jgi:MFS family permease
MWLAQMESTITSTSIVTITNDLGGYIHNSWVLTAYWLTSGALQIVIAKLSDIYGRKYTFITSLFIFTVFSGACGGSQTVFQLCVQTIQTFLSLIDPMIELCFVGSKVWEALV